MPAAPPLHRRIARPLRWLLPEGADPAALPLLLARALRAFADGYVAVLLPAYLLALGMGTLEVGVLSTATMLGSALATLAVGAWGYRFARTQLLRAAALLMLATGIGFASMSSFWPLLVVAFVGTLNPSSGDVSVFLPLEQASLAGAARGDARMARLDALRAMFVAYGALGALVWWLYRRAPLRADEASAPAAPLGPSRAVVVRLAALFSLDSFASGLVVNALLSLWLFERYGLSLAQAGQFFFWAGLLSATSQLAAPAVARRIGLLNTMVFTHIPANVCLALAAFAPSMPIALALLLTRSALSQMDVPPRTAYVMAIVTPAERAAAASFTAVPRSLAAAVSPSLTGALIAAGWLSVPLLASGVLKLVYDVTLWRAFRAHPPREH